MTQHNKIKNFDVRTIHCAKQCCHFQVVPAKGATGSSLQLLVNNHSRELLYLHPNFWDEQYHDLIGGFPLLFPICARLQRLAERGAYLYDGKIYHLPIHGFAPYVAWQVEQQTQNAISLILTESPSSLEIFPFKFRIKLRYLITHRDFSVEVDFYNADEKAMPYYAGFHPYLLTPENPNKSQVKIFFEPTRRFQYNETLTDLIGEQALLEFPQQITHPLLNEQLFFLGKNKTVQLNFNNEYILNLMTRGITHPDLFSYLQLYTIPEKPFICVEPWMSFPNALNTVSGVRWLAPHQHDQAVFRLWVD